MATELLTRVLSVSTVAKSKKPESEPIATGPKQYALRLPQAVAPRIEKVAEALGLDEAVLLRMIVVENLSAYERRAERVSAGLPPTE